MIYNELTSEWQSFAEEFVATMDDDNAPIHFDVGDSDVEVEVSDADLRSLPDGKIIKPDLSKIYFDTAYSRKCSNGQEGLGVKIF